jgi:membrane-anchored protein YejM (alkaline phosphatase superfamily)
LTNPLPNLLVVAIDGLSASFLGPYGNTWLPTPALNAFSAESLLAEFCFLESTDLRATYASYWLGCHPLQTAASAAPSLIDTWKLAGYRTALVSDDGPFLETSQAQAFDEHVLLRTVKAEQAAEELEETTFAHLVKLATDHAGQMQAPFAIWLHARGCYGQWDAPLELREQLRDEDDPPALSFLEPPIQAWGADYDPDQLLGYTQAYAAQVMALDFGLGELRAWLEKSGRARDTLVAITSPRGYLLGQQGYVGGSEQLLEDQIHVPLIVRFPDRSHAAERELGLLTPRDVYRLLNPTIPWEPPARDRILLTSASERALRTCAWYLRGKWSSEDEANFVPQELYAKPDDRFEVNNVISRAQDMVEQMSAELLLASTAATQGQLDSLAPLAETLVDTLR